MPCMLPGENFTNLAGDHVCESEGFRNGPCEDCEDLIESEGLCGHGNYPDSCGYSSDVIRVEWRQDGGDWQVADDPQNNPAIWSTAGGLHETRKVAYDNLLPTLTEICGELEGEVLNECFEMLEIDSPVELVPERAGAAIVFGGTHVSGGEIDIRVIRGE